MKKKAQAGNPIFGVILTVIVLFALSAFVFMAIPLLRGVSAGELCKLSATSMANTKFFGIESPIIKDLKCNTHFVKLKEDGIYTYDGENYRKDSINYKSFKQNPEYNTQKLVADELHQCWRYLGQGEIDPFGNYDDSSKCVICSQIEWDDNAKKQNFDKFNDFLMKNYVKDDTGAQITYWDYLTAGARNEEGGTSNILLTTEPQSVVFMSVKPDKIAEVGLWGGLTGAGAGACSATLPALGWFANLAGKIPGLGRWPKLIMIGSKAAGVGRKGFAFACKEASLQRKGLERGLFIAGSYVTTTTVNGDSIPKVVMVQLMPTAEVSKRCEKLYG